ncbi:hypothetical protein B0H17DRAFT_1129949 [Mycena rosella]|uniref:Uncharacterized protein n=1 Tax=Mycena rosella TaxID=1033263 RepID=A0AAD7DSG8_MYCRO|nr:hypothetical protein B0H17DRAFT_1129949 [Mycena rosella]
MWQPRPFSPFLLTTQFPQSPLDALCDAPKCFAMTTKGSKIPRQTKNSQLMDFRNDVFAAGFVERNPQLFLTYNWVDVPQLCPFLHQNTLDSGFGASTTRPCLIHDSPNVKIEPLAPSVLTGPPGLIKAEPPRRCMLLLSFSYQTPPTPRPPTPSKPVELAASAAPSPDNPLKAELIFAQQPTARPDGHITTCAGFAHKPGTFLAHVPYFVQCAVLAGACAGFNMYLPSGFRWSRCLPAINDVQSTELYTYIHYEDSYLKNTK